MSKKSASGFETADKAGNTKVSEMKERSATTNPVGSPTMSPVKCRILVLSRTNTLGSCRNSQANCP